MERRKSKRIAVKGNLGGRMVLAADLDIRDLSLAGIRFVCPERVAPGSRVQLLIHKDRVEARVSCTVVRSLLMDGQAGGSSSQPQYEVGASFGAYDDEVRGRLKMIMELLGKDS